MLHKRTGEEELEQFFKANKWRAGSTAINRSLSAVLPVASEPHRRHNNADK